MTPLDRRYLGSFLHSYRVANRINMNLSGDKLHILMVHKAVRFEASQRERELVKLNKFMENVWRENV